MLVFPDCKINLGLRILNKRADGYHNIETIFYPVPLKDALEIIQSGNREAMQFSSSGLVIKGDCTDNLCIKAYQLLKKDFPHIPSLKIHLHKTIPMGAGLGGGSADAAFTLQLLNDQFHLNLSTHQLINYALRLGSDCPFFILHHACLGTGRGEILQKISLNLSAYQVMLINPGIHVNTSDAFAALQLQHVNYPIASLAEIISEPVEDWQHSLKNDFEIPVFNKYPAIKEIKQTLYQNGAAYSAMSGSGSTVFGLFSKNFRPAINFDSRYFVRLLSL